MTARCNIFIIWSALHKTLQHNASCRLHHRASNRQLRVRVPAFRAAGPTSWTGARPPSCTKPGRSRTTRPSWSTATRSSGHLWSWSCLLQKRCAESTLWPNSPNVAAWKPLAKKASSTRPCCEPSLNSLSSGLWLESTPGWGRLLELRIRPFRKYRAEGTNGPSTSLCATIPITPRRRIVPEIRPATTPTPASTFHRWKKLPTELFSSTLKCPLTIGCRKNKTMVFTIIPKNVFFQFASGRFKAQESYLN